ncbi:hypothetical protein [Psychromicrobium lacuslunae]|uniref:Uncharacterized protein n=1 Tax=Psychromicrobium lacuslunae TaxID=1618207 RepID=A0A0D4BZ77_9MICC|nr:hypothetical protein [Psychromicrobium lacuslunae]AJT41742.1 hypothetical protein UM93_09855 [Psychromicrobium lacuslunae]
MHQEVRLAVPRLPLVPALHPRKGRATTSSAWTRDSADQAALVLRYVLERGFSQVENSGRRQFVTDLAELLLSFGVNASPAELKVAGLAAPALEILRTLLTEPIELQLHFARSLTAVLNIEDRKLVAQFLDRHQGVDGRLRAVLKEI